MRRKALGQIALSVFLSLHAWNLQKGQMENQSLLLNTKTEDSFKIGLLPSAPNPQFAGALPETRILMPGPNTKVDFGILNQTIHLPLPQVLADSPPYNTLKKLSMSCFEKQFLADTIPKAKRTAQVLTFYTATTPVCRVLPSRDDLAQSPSLFQWVSLRRPSLGKFQPWHVEFELVPEIKSLPRDAFFENFQGGILPFNFCVEIVGPEVAHTAAAVIRSFGRPFFKSLISQPLPHSQTLAVPQP